MPNRSFTGLLTVAPSVGSTKNTRGPEDEEAGLAVVAAGGADVLVAAGSGSLPPHADAAATVRPRASHCNFLAFILESPLRHILHKPTTPPGSQSPAGGIERQHMIGDGCGEVGIGSEGQRGDAAGGRSTADVGS